MMAERDYKESLRRIIALKEYISSAFSAVHQKQKKYKNELQKCKFRFVGNSADINRMEKFSEEKFMLSLCLASI